MHKKTAPATLLAKCLIKILIYEDLFRCVRENG